MINPAPVAKAPAIVPAKNAMYMPILDRLWPTTEYSCSDKAYLSDLAHIDASPHRITACRLKLESFLAARPLKTGPFEAGLSCYLFWAGRGADGLHPKAGRARYLRRNT